MDTRLYLVHTGVKGMKWGYRRYRNYDGSLTEEGRRRYRNDNAVDYGLENLRKEGHAVKKPMSKEETARMTVSSKQGEKIISGAQNVVRGTQKLRETANPQQRNRYNKRKPLTQEEIDRMSDKELRDLINRLNMEQQYSQLTSDSLPQSKLQTGLDYAESVLSIAGGVLSIAVAYKMLKG